MSYDIYFIKKENLNLENVYDVLEINEISPEDDIFISKDFMKSLIARLKSEGLKFEVFEGKDEDYFELTFPTYQLSMFNNQMAISLPYWNENSNEEIDEEVKLITNIFLENGLRGFDPQTETFITEPYEFRKSFVESQSMVDNHLSREPIQNGNSMKYLSIGLVLVVISIFIWRMIK